MAKGRSYTPKPSRFIQCTCARKHTLYQGKPQIIADIVHCVDRPCFAMPEVPMSHAQLAEIDRAARAYGWEIGRGQSLAEELDILSSANPFLDPNWAKNIPRRDDAGRTQTDV